VSRAYRLTDPWTSRQAFDAKNLEGIVLRAIASSPNGLTAGELAEMHPERDGLWKRMSVLEKKDLIVRGAKGSERYYPGTNRFQTVWYLKEQQLELLRSEE
jgi:hypothetical protein